MADYKTNDPKGWCGDPKRGSALGRPSIKNDLGEGKTLSIVRKQWVDGDYDENGTYFGYVKGTSLFWVSSEDGGIDYVIRAKDINDARNQVQKEYPCANLSGDRYEVSLDDQLLQQLLDDACESCELENTEINDAIKAAAKEYEAAVLRALEVWVGENLNLLNIDCFEADENSSLVIPIVREMSLLRGGAGYLYFMEAEGAGIGTWDGDWNYLFKNPKETIRKLSDVIAKATYKEYYKLKNALINCAFEGIKDEKVNSNSSGD